MSTSYRITTNLFAHANHNRTTALCYLKNVCINPQIASYPRYHIHLYLRAEVNVRYVVTFRVLGTNGVRKRMIIMGTSSFIEADYMFLLISETVHAVKDLWKVEELTTFLSNLQSKIGVCNPRRKVQASEGIHSLSTFYEIHNILFSLWLNIYGPEMNFIFPQDMRVNTVLTFFEQIFRKEGRIPTVYKFKDRDEHINNRMDVDIRDLLHLLPSLSSPITDTEKIPIKSYDELKEQCWNCKEELTFDTGTQTGTEWLEEEGRTPIQNTVIMSPLMLPAATTQTTTTSMEEIAERSMTQHVQAPFFDPCGMCGETGLCLCLWRPSESIEYPEFTQQMDPDAFLTFPDA
jgi:hypothetical protein